MRNEGFAFTGEQLKGVWVVADVLCWESVCVQAEPVCVSVRPRHLRKKHVHMLQLAIDYDCIMTGLTVESSNMKIQMAEIEECLSCNLLNLNIGTNVPNSLF